MNNLTKYRHLIYWSFTALVSAGVSLLTVEKNTPFFLIIVLGTLITFLVALYPKLIPYIYILSFYWGRPIINRAMIAIELADIAYILLVAAYISEFLFRKKKPYILKPDKTTLTCLILFLVWSGLSVIINIYSDTTSVAVTSIWYWLNLLQLVTAYIIFSDQNWLPYKKSLITFVIILTGFEIMIALSQYISMGADILASQREVKGTFSMHHGMLGNMLVIGLGLIAYRFFISEKKMKVIYASCFIVTLLAIIISSARSTILGIGISTFVIVFMKLKIRIKNLITIGGILTVMLTLAYFTPLRELATNSIPTQNAQITDHSSYSRLAMWTGAFEIFSKAPLTQKLFGVGIGRYITIQYPYFLDYEKRASGAHNNFIHVLMETGVVGLFLFLGLFFFLIRSFSRNYTTERMRPQVQTFTTLALLFSGITQETFWFQPAFGAFWLFFISVMSIMIHEDDQAVLQPSAPMR